MYDAAMIERFWAKVDKRGPDECWLWTGRRSKRGYGHFRTSSTPRKTRPAHAVAYEIEFGPTNGLLVCHSCDNPPCCNGKHLWAGTNAQNNQDAADKGRQKGGSTPGEKNVKAVLTDDDVRAIRRLIRLRNTNTSIAKQFGVSHGTISLIRLGKTWTHVMDV